MDTNARREKLLEIMVDYGELVLLAEDLYEDMGGHTFNSNCPQMVDGYIESFLKGLNQDERREVMAEVSNG